jgi:hypothetical protein
MAALKRCILARLNVMKARGEPIVGAGAGLSAKGEEEGGADRIVIYNSGRLEDCPARWREPSLQVNPEVLVLVDWRADRRIGRRRICPDARPPLSRLLGRFLNGAPSARARAARAGCKVQSDQQTSGSKNNIARASLKKRRGEGGN